MRGMLVAFTPCRKEKMCVDFLFLTFHGGAGLQVGEVQVGWGDTVAGHLPTRAMGTCASGVSGALSWEPSTHTHSCVHWGTV